MNNLRFLVRKFYFASLILLFACLSTKYDPLLNRGLFFPCATQNTLTEFSNMSKKHKQA